MENFVVSARKYRPATFASVVGQKHITSTLKNAIERGQLAHAYLFCGPRGVGKTTCARIFAKAINCQSPSGTEACNECESCKSFNENRSLNIHELDAASNNSVDDIRSLIEQVRVIPQVGRYSVFIIDEVHMLSAAAFNAFLKTLEEPPAHAIFILATTEKHKIIPTILSRCQIYDFNRIRVEDSVEYLKYIAGEERISVDDESLNLIAQKADGGMRDALSMFDKAVSFCGQSLNFKEVAQTLNVLDYDTYFSVTDFLTEGRYVDVLLTFDAVVSRGFSGQTFMAGLCQHMRDLLVAKDQASLSLIEFTGTLLERYRSQAGRCDVNFLFGAIAILTEADGKIRQSSNQRLLVELGLMKISGLGQKKNEQFGAVEYALPDLPDPRPAVAAQVQVQVQVQAVQTVSATQAAQAAQTTPTNRSTQAAPTAQVVQSEATTTDVVVEPQMTVPQAVEPKTTTTTVEPHAVAASAPEKTNTKPTPTRQAHRSPLISGASLADLLSGVGAESDDDEECDVELETVIDPLCESKLEQARDAIMALVKRQRPRFVAAFELMRIHGNEISIAVATEPLREEILRNKTEILTNIVETAGVKGLITLSVTVDEQVKAARPIKLEDRVRFLTDKNPMVNELRRALDMEIES